MASPLSPTHLEQLQLASNLWVVALLDYTRCGAARRVVDVVPAPGVVGGRVRLARTQVQAPCPQAHARQAHLRLRHTSVMGTKGTTAALCTRPAAESALSSSVASGSSAADEAARPTLEPTCGAARSRAGQAPGGAQGLAGSSGAGPRRQVAGQPGTFFIVVEARLRVRRAVPPAALSSWATRPRLMASFCSSSATARKAEGACIAHGNRQACKLAAQATRHRALSLPVGFGVGGFVRLSASTPAAMHSSSQNQLKPTAAQIHSEPR